MIANIDDNFGKLLAQLRAWNLETNTLVIFMTDNGGTAGVSVFNAGMRGGKNTPFLGAVRVPSFWRWPAAFRGGTDVAALTAHIDLFPTFAEIAGAQLGDDVRQQVAGRSLMPLLRNPNADWPDRILVTHVGRWEHSQAAAAKYQNCSVRNSRFRMVSAVRPREDMSAPHWELFDLQKDRGEKTNVITQFPAIARELEAAYDQWWTETQPFLVNETVPAPKMNPFKALYWQQFGGGPDEALRRAMDPATAILK
jgi:arylsulfatase A-like enzyme